MRGEIAGQNGPDFGDYTAMTRTAAKTKEQESEDRQHCDSLLSFALTTSDFPAAERADVWSDINSPNFYMRAIDDEKFNVDAEMAGWVVGDLAMIDISFMPHGGSRCSVSLNNSGGDVVALRYCTHGTMPGNIADDAVVLNADHVCLVDQQRDFHGVTAGIEQKSIYLPYHLIGYDPSRDPAARSFPIDTPVGKMLQSMMTCAFDNISNVAKSESDAFALGLAGAIRGLLSTDRNDEQTRHDFARTRKAAMRAFIQENFANPDLSVSDVCSAVGASRATTFREFKSAGGIQRYIMMRRLDHAYTLLSQSAQLRGQVTRVAFECGFRDTGQFSRAFRARFGVPPGDVLGQHLNRPPGGRATSDRPPVVRGMRAEQSFFERYFG